MAKEVTDLVERRFDSGLQLRSVILLVQRPLGETSLLVPWRADPDSSRRWFGKVEKSVSSQRTRLRKDRLAVVSDKAPKRLAHGRESPG